MLEIEGPKSTSSSHKQSERKVNPLGKANKRFLSRTINTVICHNRREVERTQANCRQRLKDLDDIHERRKSNYFYSRNSRRSQSRSSSRSRSARRSRSSSRSRSARRSRSRHRVKKSKKQRSRKRSSSGSSRSHSRSRSHQKKNKKKARKHRNPHHRSRRRSSSSNSRDRNSPPGVAVANAVLSPTEVYLEHSKKMALAVAMAYGQVLKANSLKPAVKGRESSPLSDIVKELMSDEEEENPDKVDVLSISSNDIADNVLTIDVSSNSEPESDSSSESSDAESEAAISAASCIALDETDNNNSDIEIIECPDDKRKKVPEKQQVNEISTLDSVDLTED
ncbi:hypothetical protein KR032_000583 [Drosophila birchii]|nr:hypothetical protein KR032_000583 [Drosophila birchii]